ncbi:trypsin-like serine protease [Streptomyces liangshanensis]|uniref:Trypsin-like serine protease n=1 Tax=Streptomyces liangshanensis TaxID=2717324 RepID=A0A6G9GYF9_9ACTN|nr:trypsin-like serine protease [Streptomyces liangshanensis]QIQ03254.1 trypsin-like serine protease [Streptomyces liangshanensis]
MFAGKDRKHRRKARIVIPTAAVALAVGVAGAFLLAPAQATEPQPLASAARPSVASVAQLTARVTDAVRADAVDVSASRKTELSAKTGTAKAGTATSGTAKTGAVTGKVDPKIIGGVTTSITSAPWMAQLWYYDDKGTANTVDDDSFFCGATVVAPTKVITAAHCAVGTNWNKFGAVIVGTSQLPTTDANGNTDFHGGTVVGVWRQWVNPTYNDPKIDNDIAILTLGVPVKATPLPVTKSTDTTSYKAGTQAKVYGWGRTSSTSDDISETLRTATLPVNADATCTSAYGSDYIKGHMICAGKPASGSDTGTVSACNGDSGGPLVVGGKLVGVVSWGVEDCVEAGAYSVFTKVSTYVGQLNMRIDDANLSADNKSDLFVRTSGGTGYEYDSKGTTFAAKQNLGSWSGYNVVLQTDLNRDDFEDFVLRATDGTISWLHYTPSSDKWVTTKLFTGWKTRVAIITPGDVTGDAKPDLLSIDTAGALYLYPGNGNGGFGTRTTINKSGWTQYNSVVGHGDFTGDGQVDLIAKGKNKIVYLYKGTGSASAPFSARVQVRTGWSYDKLVTTGDQTNDGIADLLVRDTGGVLWLYKGTGKATTGIWADRIRIGGGWNQYNVFG